AVDLAERGGGSLEVELAGLSEVSALAEVVGLELPAALAGGAGQDRRIDADETFAVQKVVDRLLDLVPHAQDGLLLPGAEPEVPVVEEEIDAVYLGLDRVVVGGADDREVGDTHLEATRRAVVGPHLAGDSEAGLDGEHAEALPDLGRH